MSYFETVESEGGYLLNARTGCPVHSYEDHPVFDFDTMHAIDEQIFDIIDDDQFCADIIDVIEPKATTRFHDDEESRGNLMEAWDREPTDDEACAISIDIACQFYVDARQEDWRKEVATRLYALAAQIEAAADVVARQIAAGE